MEMLTYVVSSMVGDSFNYVTGLTLGVVATILIFILPAVLPDTPSEKAGIH
jgi:hypothetical protein